MMMWQFDETSPLSTMSSDIQLSLTVQPIQPFKVIICLLTYLQNCFCRLACFGCQLWQTACYIFYVWLSLNCSLGFVFLCALLTVICINKNVYIKLWQVGAKDLQSTRLIMAPLFLHIILCRYIADLPVLLIDKAETCIHRYVVTYMAPIKATVSKHLELLHMLCCKCLYRHHENYQPELVWNASTSHVLLTWRHWNWK